MKALAAVLLALLALLAADGRAATAYVSDELVLGVYAEQNTQGPRLTTLHSGATVETLASSGDSTQVRLADGMTGWVKTVYLTHIEPATLRVKRLQAELDHSRATTPALAEAAERSEVERLRRELNLRQSDSSIAGTTSAVATGAFRTLDRGAAVAAASHLRLWIAAVCIALGCGFWLGYAVLARRVRSKFGGIKVY
jgi:hypothetical protein